MSPFQEVTIFLTVRNLRMRIMPSGKAYGIPFAKYQFWKTFRQLKNLNTVKLNGRSPGQVVTIFKRFKAWGNVLFPPAKPTAYGLQNINFERRFGNLNVSFRKINGVSPGQEVTIF